MYIGQEGVILWKTKGGPGQSSGTHLRVAYPRASGFANGTRHPLAWHTFTPCKKVWHRLRACDI